MMNKLNLIILSITVVVIICIGIYLYKNNQVHTEPFYQTSSNPITIADMATTVMANPTHEYAVFKMIGSLISISNTNEIPLYNNNSYVAGGIYPSNVIDSNTRSISISNDTGKIMLDTSKKYRIHLSFNRLHIKKISSSAELDLLINSFNSSNTRIPEQSYGNTAYIVNETNKPVTINIYTIISNVSYIIPLIRYRNKASIDTSNLVDTSTYMLIETCN